MKRKMIKLPYLLHLGCRLLGDDQSSDVHLRQVRGQAMAPLDQTPALAQLTMKAHRARQVAGAPFIRIYKCI